MPANSAAHSGPNAKRKATSEIDDVFSGKKPKTADEIDDIFSGKKDKSPEVPNPTTPAVDATKGKKKNKKQKSRIEELKGQHGFSQEKAETPNHVAEEEHRETSDQDDIDNETFEILTDETEIASKISEARVQRPKVVVETVEFKETTFSNQKSRVAGEDDGFADSRGMKASSAYPFSKLMVRVFMLSLDGL